MVGISSVGFGGDTTLPAPTCHLQRLFGFRIGGDCRQGGGRGHIFCLFGFLTCSAFDPLGGTLKHNV